MLDIPQHSAKGFCRPITMFVKGDPSPAHSALSIDSCTVPPTVYAQTSSVNASPSSGLRLTPDPHHSSAPPGPSGRGPSGRGPASHSYVPDIQSTSPGPSGFAPYHQNASPLQSGQTSGPYGTSPVSGGFTPDPQSASPVPSGFTPDYSVASPLTSALTPDPHCASPGGLTPDPCSTSPCQSGLGAEFPCPSPLGTFSAVQPEGGKVWTQTSELETSKTDEPASDCVSVSSEPCDVDLYPGDGLKSDNGESRNRPQDEDENVKVVLVSNSTELRPLKAAFYSDNSK